MKKPWAIMSSGFGRLVLVLLIPFVYLGVSYTLKFISWRRQTLFVFWNEPKSSALQDSSLSKISLVGSNYWVLYNHVKAEKQFGNLESITFASHGEYRFLDNLGPVLERWRGPLSMTIFAPGEDFRDALEQVHYYRKCSQHADLIQNLVNFHFFFPVDHMPKSVVNDSIEILETISTNCQSWPKVKKMTYRASNNLDYPVNVARMISRDSASTYFVFVADIELYPSPGLITKFLDMIKRKGAIDSRTVFVVPIFEIRKGLPMPKTKPELIQLIKNESVLPFHHNFCLECHQVPKYNDWLEASLSDDLDVFYTTSKRIGNWEPIFIGTKADPMYDTRLSWEGVMDKMTQGLILCLLDYKFAILDNAFLIHRPGIKIRESMEAARKVNQAKSNAQSKLIREKIVPELKILYGDRPGCGL